MGESATALSWSATPRPKSVFSPALPTKVEGLLPERCCAKALSRSATPRPWTFTVSSATHQGRGFVTREVLRESIISECNSSTLDLYCIQCYPLRSRVWYPSCAARKHYLGVPLLDLGPLLYPVLPTKVEGLLPEMCCARAPSRSSTPRPWTLTVPSADNRGRGFASRGYYPARIRAKRGAPTTLIH